MSRFVIEPARFGMTGSECGITQRMRRDTEWDAVQPLDAPEYIAKGSISASNQEQPGGVIYASTTLPMPARMYGA